MQDMDLNGSGMIINCGDKKERCKWESSSLTQ
jgi:hypothetical protein